MGHQRWTSVGRSTSSGEAAISSASVSAHDTKSQPNHGTDDGNDKGVDPQRPREVPDQEVESDPFCVLDDENDEEPDSDEGCDRPTTQSGSPRLSATLTLLRHGESPSREVAFTRWLSCSFSRSSMSHVTSRCSPPLSRHAEQHVRPTRQRGDSAGTEDFYDPAGDSLWPPVRSGSHLRGTSGSQGGPRHRSLTCDH